MPRDELLLGTISLDVLDANVLSAAAPVGTFVTDFESVYARPRHELYREWVGLIDHSGDAGVQGYLQVSI